MTDQIRTKARTGNIDRTRSVHVHCTGADFTWKHDGIILKIERTGNVDEPRSGNYKSRNMKSSTSRRQEEGT